MGWKRSFLDAVPRGWAWGILPLSIACSDPEASGPETAASAADVERLCLAICERGERCASVDNPAEPGCLAECLSGAPDPVRVRRDVVQGLTDCHRSLACELSDDGCLEQVVVALVPDYASSPLLERCARVQRDCGGFSDDACSAAVVFTESGQADLDACLNQSCERVGPCVDAL